MWQDGSMSPTPHILLVEDDREISALVARYLRTNDCRVSVAVDGREMDRHLAEGHFDLIVLDLMLPGEDGLAICRRLRRTSRIPIVMLTAKSDEIDRIVGLEIGADDYLAKPFSGRLLVTRVKALLRRARGASRSRIAAAGIELDEDARQVTVGRRKVSLTPKEFELLRYLVLNAGTVIRRERILERVWGYFYEGDPRTVDTHVKSLRAKLGAAGTAVTTVRGTGYAFRRGSR